MVGVGVICICVLGFVFLLIGIKLSYDRGY